MTEIVKAGGELAAVEFAPAEIRFDEAGVRAKVAALVEPYEGLDAATAAGMDAKELKARRADLNRISKELNDARKAVKAAYSAPLQEFEAKVKGIDLAIQQPLALIKDALAAKEAAAKQARRDALEAVYLEAAPALAEAVAFDAILDPRWLNASYGAKKAEEELMARVSEAARDLEILEGASLEFREETVAVFCRTLDLAAAMQHDRARAEERARIEAMNAARREIAEAREPEQEPEPEQPATAPARYEYALRIACDEAEFQALRRYLASRPGIERIGCTRKEIEG